MSIKEKTNLDKIVITRYFTRFLSFRYTNHSSFFTMLQCWCGLVVFCFLAINVLTIETRSVREDYIKPILNDPLSDNHRKLLHAYTGYRHRFEHSPNFEALRWSLKDLEAPELCEFCERGTPIVSHFIHFGFRDLSSLYDRLNYFWNSMIQNLFRKQLLYFVNYIQNLIQMFVLVLFMNIW
jgi:hypothetical protein